MKIFKFGGASVKDAESVKNVSMVLKSQGFDKCLLVISAMGKTTNELEKVVELYFKKEDYQTEIEKIKQKHIEIAKGLFPLRIFGSSRPATMKSDPQKPRRSKRI